MLKGVNVKAFKILFVAILMVCAMRLEAQERDVRSLTLSVSATNDLVWTNTHPPIVLSSFGIAFTNVSTGTVSVAITRGAWTYLISNIVVTAETSRVIEFPAKWILNNGDLLTISVTNVGNNAQAVIHGTWQ